MSYDDEAEVCVVAPQNGAFFSIRGNALQMAPEASIDPAAGYRTTVGIDWERKVTRLKYDGYRRQAVIQPDASGDAWGEFRSDVPGTRSRLRTVPP